MFELSTCNTRRKSVVAQRSASDTRAVHATPCTQGVSALQGSIQLLYEMCTKPSVNVDLINDRTPKVPVVSCIITGLNKRRLFDGEAFRKLNFVDTAVFLLYCLTSSCGILLLMLSYR